jgi:hypothetical protein
MNSLPFAVQYNIRIVKEPQKSRGCRTGEDFELNHKIFSQAKDK